MARTWPGGARLAVDDTGDGYAGLRNQIALGPEVVKLDIRNAPCPERRWQIAP
jgi:hypothetical protein